MPSNNPTDIAAGLDLRDYFAGQALVGLHLSGLPASIYQKFKAQGNARAAARTTAEQMASMAYIISDAMLVVRDREKL